eukprot:Pgem_evm2s1635
MSTGKVWNLFCWRKYHPLPRKAVIALVELMDSLTGTSENTENDSYECMKKIWQVIFSRTNEIFLSIHTSFNSYSKRDEGIILQLRSFCSDNE